MFKTRKLIISVIVSVSLMVSAVGYASSTTSMPGSPAIDSTSDNVKECIEDFANLSEGWGRIIMGGLGLIVCSIGYSAKCGEYYGITVDQIVGLNNTPPTSVVITIPGGQQKTISTMEQLGAQCQADKDSDGFFDYDDTCVSVSSDDQSDFDKDGAGNVCDTDDDGDGVSDATDNCDLIVNADQVDTDEDGVGDSCETDGDGDTVIDDKDNCPTVPNKGQKDWDDDGKGNVCDDTKCPEGQLYIEEEDECVEDPNYDPGDDNDLDVDVDGIPNALDNCPEDANADQKDSDKDGIGDICVSKYLTGGDSEGKGCSLSLAKTRSPAAGFVILFAAFGVILTARYRKE